MIYGLIDGVKVWSCQRTGRDPGKFLTKDFKDEIKQEWFYTNIANYTSSGTLLRAFRSMAAGAGLRLVTKRQYRLSKAEG